MIEKVFTDWIKEKVNSQLETKKLKRKMLDVVESDSLFLTFNYTQTLEKLYGVKESQICHIHNAVGEKLIFGHGKNDDEMVATASKCLDMFDDGLDILRALRKPVNERIQDNKEFFESCKNVSEVYSYGFSYSGVDLPYIEKIIQYLPNNCIWHIHKHIDKDGNSRYHDQKNTVRNLGFFGIIDDKFDI